MSIRSLQSVGVTLPPCIGTWDDQATPPGYLALISSKGVIDARPVHSPSDGLAYVRWRAQNWALSDEQRTLLPTASVAQLSEWYAHLSGEENDEGRTFIVVVSLAEPWWRTSPQ